MIILYFFSFSFFIMISGMIQYAKSGTKRLDKLPLFILREYRSLFVFFLRPIMKGIDAFVNHRLTINSTKILFIVLFFFGIYRVVVSYSSAAEAFDVTAFSEGLTISSAAITFFLILSQAETQKSQNDELIRRIKELIDENRDKDTL